MLRFYDIDENYVEYLRQFDKQVPKIKYTNNNRFVCGIVLSVNNISYYAPVSSNTQVQRTNCPIYDNHNNIIATIRFCYMIPAFESVLTKKDFDAIRKSDYKYANLLDIEYNYCKSHESQLLNKALAVYKIGCNKNHKFNYTCCDFKLLEQKCCEYVGLPNLHKIAKIIGVTDTAKEEIDAS